MTECNNDLTKKLLGSLFANVRCDTVAGIVGAFSGLCDDSKMAEIAKDLENSGDKTIGEKMGLTDESPIDILKSTCGENKELNDIFSVLSDKMSGYEDVPAKISNMVEEKSDDIKEMGEKLTKLMASLKQGISELESDNLETELED